MLKHPRISRKNSSANGLCDVKKSKNIPLRHTNHGAPGVNLPVNLYYHSIIAMTQPSLNSTVAGAASRLSPTLRGWLALSPLIVFLVLYLGASLAIGDFGKMPISVAFVASVVYAMCVTPGMRLQDKIDIVTAGASDRNIMQMIWIFVLAGAFAGGAARVGCIDAVVNASLRLMPGDLIPAGLFVAACFISISVGTSVGTVVALVPVAAGIAEASGSNLPMLVGIVVGGAFFGDNLSFISDTTIAATRTQGCRMTDKFWANIRIVLPAACIVLAYYVMAGSGQVNADTLGAEVDYVKILPYLVVLATAIGGMNVSLVLTLGIVVTGVVCLVGDGGGAIDWCVAMGDGIGGMGGLITVTLLAGGLLALIRHNGGIDFILHALTSRVRSRVGAQLAIASLVSLSNVCTANNTIAIITVGDLARGIARRYGIQGRRSASILDTFSCITQSFLPYGAQLLMAASLAAISPLAIIQYLYYPMALAVCALVGIVVVGYRSPSPAVSAEA